jgi:hypothetical protein
MERAKRAIVTPRANADLEALRVLEQMRFFWQQRETILASPRLAASRSNWAAFVFLYGGSIFPTLGSLLCGWQQGVLRDVCPECSGVVQVARSVRGLSVGSWSGFCSACPHLVHDARSVMGFDWIREVAHLPTMTFEHATWAREHGTPTARPPVAPSLDCEAGLSFDALEGLLRGREVLTRITSTDKGPAFDFEAVSGELRDDEGRVRLVHDALTDIVRDSNGQIVAVREGDRFDRVEHGQRVPWLERSKLDERTVYLAVGVNYLPVRYQANALGLDRWKNQPCLRADSRLPVGVLLLVADGRVPAAGVRVPRHRS